MRASVRLILAVTTGVVTLLALGHVAQAKRTVAALDFGGRGAARARASVLRPLRAKYIVQPGSRLLDACDELGISMTRGRNLAKAAQHIGAVAIIGGAVVGHSLNLAVYSGRTGQPLITGRVAVRGGRLTPRNLRKALTVILKGLRKAPKRVGRRRPRPAPAPAPAPKPEPAGSDLTFEPDPVDSSDSGSSGSVALEPGEGGGEGGEDPSYEMPLGGGEENPLASRGTTTTQKPADPAGQVEKTPNAHGSPRAAAYIGMGTWMRELTISDPRAGDPVPRYSSGAAFALSLGFKVRPMAFLSDGFAGNFYSRLRFQTMLGLESATETESFGTSLWELLWEVVGFDWKIMDKPNSPHLEVGLGFGLMGFAIDWPAGTASEMPNASYSWFLASLGGYMPFTEVVGTKIGAHLRFDYRVVSGTGEIEDTDNWYGPASTGGLGLLVGLNARYKGFVAKLEYSYTRYFYAFTEGNDRIAACPPCDTKPCTPCTRKPAGGALDQLHGFIISAGYSL
jgi:hypothetical protein